MDKAIAIELKGISKHFGEVVANKNVNLDVRKGEILSLLGENGSGKTTLMNMLAGIYFPDDGKILINGEEVVIRSPKDAFRLKIGMIHQHFKLVDVYSAIDNIILGETLVFDSPTKKEYVPIDTETDPKKHRRIYERLVFLAKIKIEKLKAITKFNWLSKNRGDKIKEIADKYGFKIDLNKKIYDMSVSEKQTVEIIKVLYRGADIFILDEPTAVLTPQESERLFDVIRNMRDDGKSIIIITHKLNEVLAVSDRVAVVRKGEHIATVNTSETDENKLTEMMVGKKVALNIDRAEPQNAVDRIVISDISLSTRENVKVLDNVSFTARSGEILGVAGIAGSGQRELLEAIAGLQPLSTGSITYYNPKNSEVVDLKSKTPTQIRELGVRLSFVPEDRLGMGLVGNMDIIDNMMLRSYKRGKTIFVDRKKPKGLAESIIANLEVATPNTHTPVRRLSGGNVQKVLVGREIASSPTVLMAAYPVRGLDINSSYTIYNLLNKQKEGGVAVIFVGEDLDVLIELCDRIMVICGGKITGIVDGRTATKEEIGLLMTKGSATAKDTEKTNIGEDNDYEN